VKEVTDQHTLTGSSITGCNRQISLLEKQAKEMELAQQHALLQSSSAAVDYSSQVWVWVWVWVGVGVGVGTYVCV